MGLSSTSPGNGELFVSTGSTIRLTFNTYMVRSSVQDAITVSPSLPGSMNWYYNSKTVLEFIPSQTMQPNTKYTVTIGTSSRDIFGTSMKKPYQFSFITRPD